MAHHALDYSIVKDSSADLGVNFKIVQNRPTVKAVCAKTSKIFFCIFVNIFTVSNGQIGITVLNYTVM